jgi:hypothetical protein
VANTLTKASEETAQSALMRTDTDSPRMKPWEGR